jgi:small-conductance mechanosensitive channel
MTLLHSIFHDLLNPEKATGIVFYGILVLFIAIILSALFQRAIHALLQRDIHHRIDRTYALFLAQLLQIGLYILFFIFYTHIIPALHSLAMALLAGVSVVSVIFGLAAQNTLGNLVAGVAVLLYRPFQIGDTVQVVAPKGNEVGVVERISLGYTVLLTSDHRRVMVPNSVVMSQTTVNLTEADPPPTKTHEIS